uniref:Protein kinase domain-containing protein n=1 Tax=Ascaris lumbricoides TaxID=6252 RepID=A0A0M3HV21_ASCLU
MLSEKSSASNKKYMPELGTEVRSGISIYKLLSVLGEGGFGTVLEVRRGYRRYAMKIEKYNKSMLHIEAAVMSAAERHSCKHICRLVDYEIGLFKGTQKPRYMFIVMPILGKDLHTLRHEQLSKRFSLRTSIIVGMQTLAAIEELHRQAEFHQFVGSCGFISRDIKPGNFAVGLREEMQHRTIFLFDFGLAKKHSDRDGNEYASRGVVGWRGTTRYGSLKAHERLDLGRRDDIESWFYVLVEITSGTLPWRHVTERNNVRAAKLMARKGTRIHLLYNCPKQYDRMLTIIDALMFEDRPPYQQIQAILEDIGKENKIDTHSRFDWDEDDSTAYSHGKQSVSDSGDTALVLNDEDGVISVDESPRTYSST